MPPTHCYWVVLPWLPKAGKQKKQKKNKSHNMCFVCVCMWMLAHACKTAGEREKVVILEVNRHFNNWIEVVQGASTFPFPEWGDPLQDATWSEQALASWPLSLPFFFPLLLFFLFKVYFKKIVLLLFLFIATSFQGENCFSHWVMSDSFVTLCSWDFPGDNIGVGCHFIL